MSRAVAIILNGISRKKKKFFRDIYPELAKRFAVKVLETQRVGHAEELASLAAGDGYKFIIAAGGDGTLNQVVNGLLRYPPNPMPPLGLIPLGTGNDFARMCRLSPSASQLINLLEANAPKPVDIGMITCRGKQGEKVIRHFINACSLGMGPAAVKRLEKSNRALGPAFTYWKAITATFFTHRPEEIHCTTPAWEWRGKIRVLAIANGQSFGNSIYIAPDALMDDGLFNTFIVGDLPLWKFLIYQQTLKSRKKINDPLISYNQAPHVEMDAANPTEIEAEGEFVGYLPASIQMMPSAMHILR